MVIEDIILIAVVPMLAAWVLWLLFKRHQLHVQVRMRRDETFRLLIEKFGTAPEFVEFLESDAGRRLLEDPMGAPASPVARVRRLAVAGVVLVALAGAFFVNALRYRGMDDINFVNEAIGLNNWGTIFVSGGVALLVAAALSHLMTRHRDR